MNMYWGMDGFCSIDADNRLWLCKYNQWPYSKVKLSLVVMAATSFGL